MKKDPPVRFADVADYLARHRSQLTRHWLRAVGQRMHIRPVSRDATVRLINQLPQLFDELCALLRDAGPTDIAVRAQHDARVHATERWRQGFALDELYLELHLLHQCVQTCARDYYTLAPSPDSQTATRDTIEQFFSDVIHGAIVQWHAQHDRRVSEAFAERDLALAAQARSDARLRIAAAAAGLGIFEWDPETDAAVWENDRMYEITGQPRERGALSAREFVELVVDPGDRESLRNALNAAITSSEDFHATFRIRTVQTGTPNVLEVSGRFLPDASGSRRVLVGTMADVTNRVSAEEALRQADRRKDVFLATLAHELRNPLAPILNAAHLLRQTDRSHDQLDWLQGLVERHATHLSHLIDDLLDLSRITAGKITLRMEVFSIWSAIDRAIEINAPAAAQHAHRLEVVDSRTDPLFVRGDSTRVTQVLANLLDNAIKYTDEGGHIRLSAARDDPYVTIAVEDNGIGMDPAAIPSLFEIFEQAPTALESTRTGLGIGLSVARALIAMHGGAVSASSDGPGKGSRFVVRLPLCDAPTRASQSSDADRAATAASRRVLIVDDNHDAALSLAMILDQHEVRTANSGEVALAIAQKFNPDVVLLDLGLPDMSGYEVAKRLREFAAPSRPVLIALTGYGQPEDRRRTREAGFDYHLVKPARPEDVVSLLATAF
ncbi:hybrid sensor histidine kinase/response regulator [Paraburkholderia diazotrophica]|uniref:hybrid sensor histidine kinase/response regulator n=1 Tax=Paraburkholderia diazotrophica TaxID=667676 RepID=UPI0031755665